MATSFQMHSHHHTTLTYKSTYVHRIWKHTIITFRAYSAAIYANIAISATHDYASGCLLPRWWGPPKDPIQTPPLTKQETWGKQPKEGPTCATVMEAPQTPVISRVSTFVAARLRLANSVRETGGIGSALPHQSSLFANCDDEER